MKIGFIREYKVGGNIKGLTDLSFSKVKVHILYFYSILLEEGKVNLKWKKKEKRKQHKTELSTDRFTTSQDKE